MAGVQTSHPLLFIRNNAGFHVSSLSGHKWKQGMWSKEEIDILMRNIDQYVKVRGVGP